MSRRLATGQTTGRVIIHNWAMEQDGCRLPCSSGLKAGCRYNMTHDLMTLRP